MSKTTISASLLADVERTVGFGVWEWRCEGGEVLWSTGLEKIYAAGSGIVRERYAAFLARVHAEDRPRVAGVRESACAAGQPFDIVYRIVRPDGEVRWVRSRGFPLADVEDGPPGLLGLDLDITDQKQLEQAHVLKDARLTTALVSSDLVIFHQDLELRYTWIANPALEVDANRLVGRTDIQLLGESAARPLVEIKRRVLMTGVGERQEVFVDNHGNAGYFDLIVEPQRDEHGTLTGIVCAATDITPRKAAETVAASASRKLEALAAHQQEALEGERAAIARDVHDQVGAFLTGIRMKLSIASERVAANDPAAVNALQDVDELCAKALAATRQICTRLRPPVLDDLGLSAACRWYVQDWQGFGGIAVCARINELGRDIGDALAIDVFRILQELLTNVSRHAGATRVDIVLRSSRGKVCLHVCDNGCGFSVAAADAGPGFGLAGMRERVRRHGGKMDIVSGGRGTRVTVRFPLGGRP